MNTIEETIKMAGFGKKKVMAKQIQFYEDKFSDEGENLIAACASSKGTSQLYVTDKRVHLNDVKGIVSNQERSIPLSSITSININKSFVYAALEINASGNRIIIEDVPVHIADEIKAIIEHLKKDASNEKTSTITPQNKDTFDIADEIRELKDLLDEGLINQDEFDAKKKQLLGI